MSVTLYKGQPRLKLHIVGAVSLSSCPPSLAVFTQVVWDGALW